MFETGDGSWEVLLSKGRCPSCKSLLVTIEDTLKRKKRECLVCSLTVTDVKESIPYDTHSHDQT
jgi:uncharacterized protein YbaR (Trm112 family)